LKQKKSKNIIQVGSPETIIHHSAQKAMVSPSKLLRRANTMQSSEFKANRQKRNLIEESKKRIMNLENEENYLGSIAIPVDSEEEEGEDAPGDKMILGPGPLPLDISDANDISDLSTPPKSRADNNRSMKSFLELGNQKASFHSEAPHHLEIDSVDDGKPLSMYNMGSQNLHLRLNSLSSSSDSLTQNTDFSSSDNSLINSPVVKSATRSVTTYPKSKFFNKKEVSNTPFEKSHEEQKNLENEEEVPEDAAGQEHEKPEIVRAKRTPKQPLTVIPVQQNSKEDYAMIDTKPTEALIHLKKSINRKKRLVELYEIIKKQGKAATDHEITLRGLEVIRDETYEKIQEFKQHIPDWHHLEEKEKSLHPDKFFHLIEKRVEIGKILLKVKKALSMLNGNTSRSSPNVRTEKKPSKRRHSFLADDSSSPHLPLRTPFTASKQQVPVSPNLPARFATQCKKPMTEIFSKDSSPLHFLSDTGQKRKSFDPSSRFTEALNNNSSMHGDKPPQLIIRKCTTDPFDNSPNLKFGLDFKDPVSLKKDRKTSIEDQNSSIISIENDIEEEESPKLDISPLRFEDQAPAHLPSSNKKPLFGRSNTVQPAEFDFDFGNLEAESLTATLKEQKMRIMRDKRPGVLIKAEFDTNGDKGLSSPLDLRGTPDFTRNVQLNNNLRLNLQEGVNSDAEKVSAEDTPNFENREEEGIPSWGNIEGQKADLQQQLLSQGGLSASAVGKEINLDITKYNKNKDFCSGLSFNPDQPDSEKFKSETDMDWARISFNPNDLPSKKPALELYSKNYCFQK